MEFVLAALSCLKTAVNTWLLSIVTLYVAEEPTFTPSSSSDQ
jgi:hypothetical protein